MEDSGNTSSRFGLTVAACEGEGQGPFEMIANVQGKDTTEVVKNTVAAPLEESRKKIRDSVVVDVEVKHPDNSVNCALAFVPKAAQEHIDRAGKSCLLISDGKITGVQSYSATVDACGTFDPPLCLPCVEPESDAICSPPVEAAMNESLAQQK